VLPNPVDNPDLHSQLWGYPETVPGEKERQNEEAAKLGLWDRERELPTLPADAVARVAERPGPVIDPAAAQDVSGAAAFPPGAPASRIGARPDGALGEPMPSAASGGTAVEDRIR
jgi:hypothetical protein